jgi:hypothetical protein
MLQPAEKKIIGAIAILGLIGGVGYLIAEQIKKNQDSGGGPVKPPPNTQIITELPPAVNEPTKKPVVALPIPLQYNENTPLFYKSGYTKMIKTLQSIINNISARNNYPLIAVDGVFGMQTLTKVRAYFGGQDNVTLKQAFEYDKMDKLSTRTKKSGANPTNARYSKPEKF